MTNTQKGAPNGSVLPYFGYSYFVKVGYTVVMLVSKWTSSYISLSPPTVSLYVSRPFDPRG